jgi:hypothetical protein
MDGAITQSRIASRRATARVAPTGCWVQGDGCYVLRATCHVPRATCYDDGRCSPIDSSSSLLASSTPRLARPVPLPTRRLRSRARKYSPDVPAAPCSPDRPLPPGDAPQRPWFPGRSRRGWCRRRTPQRADGLCPPGWGAGGRYPGPSGLYVHSSQMGSACQEGSLSARLHPGAAPHGGADRMEDGTEPTAAGAIVRKPAPGGHPSGKLRPDDQGAAPIASPLV